MSMVRRTRIATDPFWRLVATAKRLQAPGGCPWDRVQTVDSLLPHLIEETWEVFEAVRRRRDEELQEELGDVLYTVLFLTLIAERRGLGSLESLLTETRKKMIRRHPHVFGPAAPAATSREAYHHWQRSKRLEGKRRYSPSDEFRRRLVTGWERLYAHLEESRGSSRNARQPIGSPKQPSARQGRMKDRWRGPARN